MLGLTSIDPSGIATEVEPFRTAITPAVPAVRLRDGEKPIAGMAENA
jgi:hypothetical protein